MYPTKKWIIKKNNIYVSKLERSGWSVAQDGRIQIDYDHELDFFNAKIITTSSPSAEEEMRKVAKTLYGELIQV